MVKDRLVEFQQKAGIKGSCENRDWNEGTTTNSTEFSTRRNSAMSSETTSFLQLKTWDEMESFLENVQTTRKCMDEMAICLSKIRALHSKILNEPGIHPRYTDELNDNMGRFIAMMRDVSNTIKRIKEENNRKDLKISTANLRIRRNHENVLRRALLKMHEEFHTEQVEYKEKCRTRINSYLNISGLHMPDEEVDQAIEDGRLFHTVGIMMAERDKKLLFEDVKSRHEDIIRLEKAIRELHDMFQDLAMLVESQGEMVNHIESNVENAKEYALNALQSVKTAEAAKRRNIKLKIGLAICIVITIILLFFLGTSAFCFYLPFICH